VLPAWGIKETGAKHLLGLLPGTKEETASCRDVLWDLKARGLRDPFLVVTDGAPGLIRAVQEVLPRSLRQRCLAHKMRNLRNKVPEERWREIGPAARLVCQAPSHALATRAAEAFPKAWGEEFPAMVTRLEMLSSGIVRRPLPEMQFENARPRAPDAGRFQRAALPGNARHVSLTHMQL